MSSELVRAAISHCPFCGQNECYLFGFSVRCDKCSAQGPYDRVSRISIEKWNQRPLASAEKADDGWIEVESAPRDGTSIIVWTGIAQYVVSWTEGDGGFPLWCVDDNKHGPFYLRGADPTHWRPLPAPPKARGER